MSILGLCLIVLGTVFSFFGTYFNDKEGQNELTTKIQEKNNTIDQINSNNAKLIDQNTSLLSSTNEVSATNKDLNSQNTGMLEKVSKYQADIEDRNKRIQLLEGEVLNVKEYGFYATLDIYGRNVTPGYGIKFSSDLSDRMEKILTVVDGQTYVKNDKSNLPLVEEVIKRYPNFPFGYFAKFVILKAFGNSEWKTYARKAEGIFEITITIMGHHPCHDEALKILKRDLATN